MKYIFQFARIIGFCLAGELLHKLVPLPVPAAIYGLVLLSVALLTGVVKIEQVKQAGDFLTSLFPLLFVPTVAGVMEIRALLRENLVPIVIVVLPVTWAVMAVAGKVTQLIMDRRSNNG